jgi:redox-sensing transcriptional repressor
VNGHRIPEATVKRLPVYLRVLAEASGSSPTISSELLAEKAGVNAAQVRKDLSHLGSYGTRGVGYEVGFLMHQISRRLGVDTELRVVIVGAGNLGQALATYGGFASRGFQVVATFDSDPDKVGNRVGVTNVQPVTSMPETLRELHVDIGVVTTPASAAQSTVDVLVSGGVSCILNFAPTTVAVPDRVALRQVDLGVELQILSFYRQGEISPVAVGE